MNHLTGPDTVEAIEIQTTGRIGDVVDLVCVADLAHVVDLVHARDLLHAIGHGLLKKRVAD